MKETSRLKLDMLQEMLLKDEIRAKKTRPKTQPYKHKNNKRRQNKLKKQILNVIENG